MLPCNAIFEDVALSTKGEYGFAVGRKGTIVHKVWLDGEFAEVAVETTSIDLRAVTITPDPELRLT